MKKFLCSKGHLVETATPFGIEAFGVAENEWEEETPYEHSGPLCQICLVRWMKAQFPTEELVGERER